MGSGHVVRSFYGTIWHEGNGNQHCPGPSNPPSIQGGFMDLLKVFDGVDTHRAEKPCRYFADIVINRPS